MPTADGPWCRRWDCMMNKFQLSSTAGDTHFKATGKRRRADLAEHGRRRQMQQSGVPLAPPLGEWPIFQIWTSFRTAFDCASSVKQVQKCCNKQQAKIKSIPVLYVLFSPPTSPTPSSLQYETPMPPAYLSPSPLYFPVQPHLLQCS